eukprot:TRINITY_DN1080_c0_g1_i9.p2 TRINITY_DN1080_c0_g1~~TRINITY_DN1080_c0_g1_i9.p2  ORF type:complete len:154 (+),score=33.89 TRINITY_DN1080_c0_g1_i9:131-592(+)
MLLERFKIKSFSKPFDQFVQVLFNTPSFSVALSNNLGSLGMFDSFSSPVPFLFFSKFEQNIECLLRSVLCMLLEGFKIKNFSKPFGSLLSIFFNTPSSSIALSNNLDSLRMFDSAPILRFFSKFEKNIKCIFGSVLCVLLEGFKIKNFSKPFD